MKRFENDTAESHPLEVELEAGTYSWCQCGKTKTVPFCDGSHAGSGMEPLTFEVKKAGTVVLCNCGLTHNPPYCDGSHAAI
jgi:CDGSH-type Zn-finger protein